MKIGRLVSEMLHSERQKKTIANTLKFCELAFMVIRFAIVFLQNLHETSDRYIK